MKGAGNLLKNLISPRKILKNINMEYLYLTTTCEEDQVGTSQDLAQNPCQVENDMEDVQHFQNLGVSFLCQPSETRHASA